MAIGHTGSWGTPDLGITEAIQGFFNNHPTNPGSQVPRTSTGGSNLIGGAAQAPAYNGQVQGIQTQQQPQVNSAGFGPLLPDVYANAPKTTSTPQPQSQQTGGAPSQDQLKNEYFHWLDQRAGDLPNIQRGLEDQINNLFGSQQSSINTATQSQLGDLELSRQKAETNKANSLRDLESDMRNQLSAGQRFLGGIPGASNSTATGQYNAALGKQGSKNRANLQQQANEIFSAIDTNVAKVKSVAQDQMQQLEAWKNTELSKVAQYIQSLRGQIDQQKGQYIQSQLLNIDQQVNSYRQGIAQWAINNSQNLEQLKSNFSQLGVNVQPFQQPGFDQLSMNGGAQGSGTALFGSLKRDEQNRPY